MRWVTAFAAGGLFGAGLVVSGMVDTRRVQGWLDFLGAWDPTLAFVMAGAILPMAVAWMVAARQGRSLLGTPIPARMSAVITRDLILGSSLFGAGWALAGLCPGPAMAVLGFAGVPGLVFLLAMGAGMLVAIPVRQRLTPTARA